MGEPRHRLPITGNNGGLQKINKAEKKKYDHFTNDKDKKYNCKYFIAKIIILSLVVSASFTFLFSPSSYRELCMSFKSSFIESVCSKQRSETHVVIDWKEVKLILDSLVNNEQKLRMGLVNFNKREEIQDWVQYTGNSNHVEFPFELVNESIQWSDLYPGWIDEEQVLEVPKCPDFPMPHVRQGIELDLVVVKVPCKGAWSRDVARLQLQFAAAHVASVTNAENILVMDSCQTLPNLFTCNELVAKRQNLWLYNVDLGKLRKKLYLPVGSCELSVSWEGAYDKSVRQPNSKEAYVTILHSAQFYVCGAMTLAQSIRLSGSTRDLVALVDENISPEHRKGLELAGWKVVVVERILNPKAKFNAYNEWNYSKFRIWQLTMYDKILFIDADILILRNIDFLFDYPEISAAFNNATRFNSGVMVVEPSNCTFQLLMDHIDEIVPYNGGDQGYLNEIFTWWHRIPRRMNYLKHFWSNDTEEFVEKTRLFAADPPELYVLHYLGLKPWICFRDYDCNWNVEDQRSYASDVAHALWWKVHDKMPEDQQRFCLLTSKQKASLERARRRAQNASFPDEHWKRNITDPRLHICYDKFCFGENLV